MIRSFRWQGDHDGHVVFEREIDGGTEALTVDRPGDMVTTIQAHRFPGELEKCAAAVYGVCLAMRRVPEPRFIRHILEKAIPFLASSDVESVHMHKTMRELKTFVENADAVGFELRDAVLEHAHRFRDATSAR